MGPIAKFGKTIDQEYQDLMQLLWGAAAPIDLKETLGPAPSRQEYISNYIIPARGKLVSRHLPGKEHATPTHPEGHTGIDIAGERGSPVHAMAPGYVSDLGVGKKGGNWVVTRHENGRVKAYYAHLDSINVQKGQQVDQNTIIGAMGDTGNAKGRGVHLHFQVSVDGRSFDPLTLQNAPIGSLTRTQRVASLERLISIFKESV